MRVQPTDKIYLLQSGAPYIWGEVVAIHEIGSFAIIEYHPFTTVSEMAGAINRSVTHFGGQVNGVPVAYYNSIDEALVGLIAYKYEGNYSNATSYIMRMLNMPVTEEK